MVFFNGRVNGPTTNKSTLINEGIFALTKKQAIWPLGHFNTMEIFQWAKIFNLKTSVKIIFEFLTGKMIIPNKDNIINIQKQPQKNSSLFISEKGIIGIDRTKLKASSLLDNLANHCRGAFHHNKIPCQVYLT